MHYENLMIHNVAHATAGIHFYVIVTNGEVADDIPELQHFYSNAFVT